LKKFLHTNSRACKITTKSVISNYLELHHQISSESKFSLTHDEKHLSIIFFYLSKLFCKLQNNSLIHCFQHLSQLINQTPFKFQPDKINSEFLLLKNNNYTPSQIGYVIDISHQYYLSNKNKNCDNFSNHRKMLGAFYTPHTIAQHIVNKTYTELKKNKVVYPRFLDMGCGTGVFLSCICQILLANNIDKNKILSKLISGIDIDFFSILFAQLIIQAELHIPVSDVQLLKNFKTIDILFDANNDSIFELKEKSESYDAIVMNPPYERLKPDKVSAEEKIVIQNKVRHIKKNPIFKKSSSGSINLYSLFIDKSFSLLSNNGVLGAIVPITFLADKSASEIRKYFIEKKSLSELFLYPEKINIFEQVNQACTILIANFKKKTEFIKIYKMSEINKVKSSSRISINIIKSVSPSYFPISCINQNEIHLLEKIHKSPRIKDIVGISNKRGELDLTLDKKYLSGKDCRLIKGASISLFSYQNIFNVNFDAFVSDKCSSSNLRVNDIFTERIAGQQISNMGSKQRLKFSLIPKNYILGNSINYLTVNKDLEKINGFNIYTLLGFLNSEILNWRFKLTSSNNHVNNYEINDLPIAINASSQKIRHLNEIVSRLSNSTRNSLINLELYHSMNRAVLDCYGI
tara:strand:+ start:564 stop:2462 length:1899 start_codon:yes stop_codon:yes gene_type:complete